MTGVETRNNGVRRLTATTIGLLLLVMTNMAEAQWGWQTKKQPEEGDHGRTRGWRLGSEGIAIWGGRCSGPLLAGGG